MENVEEIIKKPDKPLAEQLYDKNKKKREKKAKVLENKVAYLIEE